jgi:hypothetical protein
LVWEVLSSDFSLLSFGSKVTVDSNVIVNGAIHNQSEFGFLTKVVWEFYFYLLFCKVSGSRWVGAL